MTESELVEINHAPRATATNHSSRKAETDRQLSKVATVSSSLALFDGFTREEKYQLAGWVMFVLCAIFYMIASIEGESITSLIGSLIFLVACLVFMVPLIWKDKQA